MIYSLGPCKESRDSVRGSTVRDSDWNGKGAKFQQGRVFPVVRYAVLRTAGQHAASASTRSRVAYPANLPVGSRSPQSHRARVDWSTPILWAASFCERPSTVLHWIRRSAQPRGGGKEL